MFYVEVEPNVKIAVYDINFSGNKTIVFIHGWPLDHTMFEYQYNILSKYGYRIVSLDLRGFGKSDKPWDGYNYDRMADDIEAVLDTLGIYNAALVGFSMGGAIAIKYAGKYGNKHISKLILISAAAPSFTKYDGYPYGATKDEINRLISKLYQDRPNLIKEFSCMFFATPVSNSFLEHFRATALSTEGYATIKTLEVLRDENVMDSLYNINIPTVIFQGSKDLICDPSSAKILKENIRNSKLYYFENSGHACFYDELDKFNNLFLENLK